jgi:hypothetical protein
MEYTEEEEDKFIDVIDYYNKYCKENGLTADDSPFDDFIKDREYQSSGIELTSSEEKRLIEYYDNSKPSKSSRSPKSSISSKLSKSSRSPKSSRSSRSSNNEEFDEFIENYESYCKSFGLSGDDFLSFEEYIQSDQYKVFGEELTADEKKQIIKYYNSKYSSNSASVSSASSASPISRESTHTLLLNCCHGGLNVYYKGQPNVQLAYMYNPIQHLNRLIQGAQLCITSMYVSDFIKIIKMLDTKSWDSLNKEKAVEIKNFIANLKSYFFYRTEHEFDYDYMTRKNQIHNTFEFVVNKFNDKIINKEWQINLTPQPESTPHDKVFDMNGLYFVNETTFIVPRMDNPYVNNSTDLNRHFNFTTRQITYSKLYNILLCPIYRQYNDYKLKYYFPQGVPMSKDWTYNYNISDVGFYNMISKTTADVLYNFLVNIPNVSMIDNSCESHDLKPEVNKLKELRDIYRELGPRVGKKLVKKMTKKIYRLEGKLRSKARGKHRKRSTRKRNTRKRNTRKRNTRKRNTRNN